MKTIMRVVLTVSVAVCLVNSRGPTVVSAAGTPTKPKLIVAISIDQFRADYLMRFASRFLPAKDAKGRVGGFKYLMENGAYYPLAEYEMIQCVTGPGHSVILSGSYPYRNGIAANFWYDSKADDKVYCVEDQSIPTVGATPKSKHIGTSPKNFLGSTVGDELKNGGYPSRVVSIALKDRAAILMGGHRADLALWLDGDSFHWVSSRYYLPKGELPQWVADINARFDRERGKEMTWQPAGGAKTGYTLDRTYDFAQDRKGPQVGKFFPHTLKNSEKYSTSSPYGLDILFEAVQAAVKNYELGQRKDNDKAPDLLAIGVSAHDYVGHAFGPESLEMEEMTVAEDKRLSDLFNWLNTRVKGGLKETVIVLTADHGVAPVPEVHAKDNLPSKRINQGALIEAMETALTEKYGAPAGDKWLGNVENIQFWLKTASTKPLIDKGKVTLGDIEQVMKSVALKTDGILSAHTATELADGKFPLGVPGQFLRNQYVAGKTANLLVIQKPFSILEDSDYADHQSGFSYDRYVPLVIAGTGIRPGRYAQQARVIDIAPTLSYISQVLPPAQSEGRVLSEAIASSPPSTGK